MISELSIAEAFFSLEAICGGSRDDYFGLLYLEREHQVPRENAIKQIAFGRNECGFDAFHFDKELRDLYIFQFSKSQLPASLKEPFQRLIATGVEQILQPSNDKSRHHEIVFKLRHCLAVNRRLIEKLRFCFVFTGNPYEAECDEELGKLREDFKGKEYVIAEFFADSPVRITIDFRSSNWGTFF
jgi:hypothetical protein